LPFCGKKRVYLPPNSDYFKDGKPSRKKKKGASEGGKGGEGRSRHIHAFYSKTEVC